jgi:hypothetical protein
MTTWQSLLVSRDTSEWSGDSKLPNQTKQKQKELKNMSTNQNQQQELSESAAGNLASIEEEIETSSQYFKPKPDRTYVISMDPQKDKIVPTENDRFKDANGNPIKRYECKITHVNSAKEQKWTVSKTVCLQIIEQLRKNYTVLRVTRHGEDRTTTYQIEGMQQ